MHSDRQNTCIPTGKIPGIERSERVDSQKESAGLVLQYFAIYNKGKKPML